MKKVVLLLATIMVLGLSAVAQSTTMITWQNSQPSYWPVDKIDSITFYEEPEKPFVPCTFNISIHNITKTTAFVCITPSNDDWYYYLDVLPVASYQTYESDSALASYYIGNLETQVASGESIVQFLFKRQYRHLFCQLQDTTDYYVIVFCVDTENNSLLGNVTKTAFTTGINPTNNLSFSEQITDTAVWYIPNDNRIKYLGSYGEETMLPHSKDSLEELLPSFYSEGNCLDAYTMSGPAYFPFKELEAGHNYIFFAQGYSSCGYNSDFVCYSFHVPNSSETIQSPPKVLQGQRINILQKEEKPIQTKTHIVVQPLSGQDQYYSLAQIGRLVLQNETLYLYDKAGIELGHTLLTEVGKIVFGEKGDNLVDEKHESYVVYPNPTHDMLIVRGIEPNQTIRIYSLQGLLIQTVQTQNEGTIIQVNNLPNGTYLLQLGAELVKFIKK